MAVATIHPQLYVTIQYRKDAGNDDGLLGFASPYTKDSAFEKRRRTQESWAYGGYGTSFEIQEDGGIIPTKDCKIDKFVLFATKCYPIIIDNVPTDGFEIAKSVRRYGWNGGGNVKWRITDPRGFDLEISSENFASVISCCTMVNGVIQGKCLWGRVGKDNVLLPESSDPFKEAYEYTKLSTEKVSLKDVKRGDIVKVIYKRSASGVITGRYLGRQLFISPTSTGDANKKIYQLVGKTTDKHVFEVTNEEGVINYYCITKPVIGQIVTSVAVEMSMQECLAVVNNEIMDRSSANFVEPPENFIMAVSSVAEAKTVKLELRDSALTYANAWPETDGKYSWRKEPLFTLISEDGNTWYTGKNVEKGSYNARVAISALFKVAVNGVSIETPAKTTVTKDTWYSSRETTNVKPIEFLHQFDTTKFTNIKSVWLTCDNATIKLVRTPTELSYFFDHA